MKGNKNKWILIGVLVIITALAGWIDGPKHPAINVGRWHNNLSVKLGLDLLGGAHLVYRANLEGIASEDADDALAGVRDVIERRVNVFGVSEPIVRTNRVGGEHRVIVELAGVNDPDQAIKMIGATPQLDFRREVEGEEAAAQFNVDDPASAAGPIFERTELTGRNLKRSSVSFDAVSGQPQVDLEFDSEGANTFAELTKANIGKRIAIYLDNVPISAPVVQSEITNGRAVITGGFALDEAKQLANRLNAGALPVPIELIGQQTVGPTLGKLSVEQSIMAGFMGLVVVIMWMILFYRLPGLIATITLVLYALYFLALVKLIPVTLTLAGAAGFILTVGMAIDANVLIFERFRENLRLGKSVGYAAEDGFREAWSSIKASNISSMLTVAVLYSFGTSIIRGFALTFGIGIILSMLTAVVITRSLLLLVLSWKAVHKPFLLAVKSLERIS